MKNIENKKYEKNRHVIIFSIENDKSEGVEFITVKCKSSSLVFYVHVVFLFYFQYFKAFQYYWAKPISVTQIHKFL